MRADIDRWICKFNNVDWKEFRKAYLVYYRRQLEEFTQLLRSAMAATGKRDVCSYRTDDRHG